MAYKEIIKFNGMEVRFALNEKDTNKALTMFEVVIEADARMPVPHYHEAFDEAVYGLEGTVSYIIDGKDVEIGPGDSAYVRRGVVHSFHNKTDKTIRFLAVITPGIFGPQYFTDIAWVFNAGGAPDINKIKTIMAHHGLVPIMTQ